ncbi:MAG: ParB/RepB/Spo0J family partition protein [Burkholderiaceae bacterium]|jgi:ParB family chromosome partitioning protein|nr:ParB/RepB/Spo0J family partition protein [Burkholderiaceae bacterium]
MTVKRKKGLGGSLDGLLGGRGVAALLGDEPSSAEKSPWVSLALDRIQPGKYQPRTVMDEGTLTELAQSISDRGVLQPILVRPLAGGRYEILAGERRFRAAQMAGLETIPSRVMEVDDLDSAAIALIENILREDLNPLEQAHGIHRLIVDFGFTHDQAGRTVGKSRSGISNILRLLNLVSPVQSMLRAGDIDMGHARALLSVEGATQVALATQVVAKRLSVRETERLVTRELSSRPSSGGGRTRSSKSADITRLEEELSDLLATPVIFQLGAKNRGKIVIDFADLDVLDGVIQRLRGSSPAA